MNVINQIMIAIISTWATGTLAFGLWKLTRRLWREADPTLMYLMLRMACVFYLVPVGYLWMQVAVRDGYIQTDSIWQLNFSLTGFIWLLCAGLLSCWFVTFVRRIVIEMRRNKKADEIFNFSVPEEDAAVVEEFLKVKRELKIKRKIRLMRNRRINSPMIRGIFSSSVLLPARKYDRRQLNVIFHHELMHYKNHDVFFKWCGMLIKAMQNRNPLLNDLLGLLDEWSEYNCDARTLDALGDEVSLRCYFEVILESMRVTPAADNESYVFSMLCDNQSRLERRIDNMMTYQKIKTATRRTTPFFAFVFVMMSVTTTFAAGTQAAKLHDYIYKSVEETTAETTGLAVFEEHYLPAAQDESFADIVYANPELEIVSPMLNANELVSFNWTVTPGTRHVSGTFYVKKGQTISVSATASPGTNTYWICIMDPFNNVRYVEGTGSLSHGFSITSSGNYRVGIQNRSDANITAAGSYSFY